ncbi:MAG TPA: hypothetical protein VEM39_03850 [Myxococcaceae bacterium]|nr:hypothetical protein [Myxococcaceae bacterium]
MFLAASLASVLWLGTAAAEPAPVAAPSKTRVEPKSAQAQSAAKKKVIRLDAITVEGRIQKPQAFYILQRSNLNFEELNRSESFVPKVVKSVERDPF